MPIKFAGKLNAFSRGPRGFFVKLEIGGDDDWQELAAAPLGTTFGVAMVPIDAETGVIKDASPGSGSASPGFHAGQQRDEAGKSQTEIDEINAQARRKLRWSEMSRAQQAGILSNDATFQLWLSKHYPVPDAKDAAEVVRMVCGVSSRAELSEDRVAGKRWDALVTRFYQDTGRLAEMRG